MVFLGLVLASVLILFAVGVQESASAAPYVDIMDYAFDPESVIIIGNVIDGKKIVDGLDIIVKYDIKVETDLKNNIEKHIIHTFSQPTPTENRRDGNNYSYFDIGDRVILVLHPPNDANVAKKHPDTYYINDTINPHYVEGQLQNIWSVKKQIEYLLIKEPEHISDDYYKTRYSEILCNMGLKQIYKQTDVFASCVTSDTFKKLLQRGWNAIGPVLASDLKQNYAIDLSTDKQQYSIGDDVKMTMKNSGDISVIMKSDFGDLTLRNISTDELIKMWYSSDSDINRNSGGILRLLMPNDQRILERNLWDESKIESGTYEISITYTMMNKGTPVNISSYAQFNVK